jgi:hypothetical protein
VGSPVIVARSAGGAPPVARRIGDERRRSAQPRQRGPASHAAGPRRARRRPGCRARSSVLRMESARHPVRASDPLRIWDRWQATGRSPVSSRVRGGAAPLGHGWHCLTQVAQPRFCGNVGAERRAGRTTTFGYPRRSRERGLVRCFGSNTPARPIPARCPTPDLGRHRSQGRTS